jgi:hypothetical protein
MGGGNLCAGSDITSFADAVRQHRPQPRSRVLHPLCSLVEDGLIPVQAIFDDPHRLVDDPHPFATPAGALVGWLLWMRVM